MRIFYGTDKIPPLEKSVIAIGSFDGVHRGHRLIIETMNRKAEELNAQPVIITFDVHPRQVLRGENNLLSTLPEKLILLEEAGAQNVVILHFDKTFSQTPYDIFAQEILINKLHAVAIFSSEGHHFGRNREGNNTTLEKFGLQIYHLPRYENISSTAVRQAILCGNMEMAEHLLGSPYLIIEPVIESSKLMPSKATTDAKYIRLLNNTK